jgi:uncharacterized protein (TIGR00299 family) protein
MHRVADEDHDHHHQEPKQDSPPGSHHHHEHVQPLKGDLARGAGAGKVLFLDAFSGVAGDMLVAALLDLGVPLEKIESALDCLSIDGYSIEVGSTVRSGIMARRFLVHVESPQPDRTYAEIRTMLDASGLPKGALDIAQRAFKLLGEAESSVHSIPLSEVHFHEVGAVDSIVDMVAVAVALDHLGAEVVSSPLPMGNGMINARHGVLPLPAPATVSCLRGVPTYGVGVEAELVTPTGACLVASIAEEFTSWPDMKPERVGWGGGTRELPDRPNLLRLVLGTPNIETRQVRDRQLVVMEANVDDMTPEIAAFTVERALSAGALDAWTTPIGMKKGRSAVMLSALAKASDADELARVLLTESTSLGLRIRPTERIERPRRTIEVATAFGPIPIKIADGDGLPPNVAPEFEACRDAALAHKVPLKKVFESALTAAQLPVSGDLSQTGSPTSDPEVGVASVGSSDHGISGAEHCRELGTGGEAAHPTAHSRFSEGPGESLDPSTSRLLTNLSHEFRTPLTLILGPLEDLRDGIHGSLRGRAEREISVAIRNAHRLLHLVNQIQDLARLESGSLKLRPRRTDLVKYLKRLADSFATQRSREKVNFRFDAPAAPVLVSFDPDSIEKVVVNVLSNSFKFTPDGGSVVLSLALSDGGDGLEITVEDTGPGIPAEDLPHIFERFYRVEKLRHIAPGSGVGLSLARELVEMQGCSIKAESQEGIGTKVTVTLPTSPPDLQPKPAAKIPDPPSISQQEKAEYAAETTAEDVTTVLLIEDDRELREYMRDCLAPRYRILEAADGQEGLDLMRSRLPDLAISDVVMPNLDGISLCHELKRDRNLSFIPIILLTAKSGSKDKVEGLEAGADDYLVKPFRAGELEARVKNLIESRKRLLDSFKFKRGPVPTKGEIRSVDEELLERATAALEANAGDEEFTIESLSHELNISRGHLHKRFKEVLGKTPSEVLRDFRLERSAHLLGAQAGSVSEIAYGSGFRSVSHFSKCFREKYGCTPSEYKKGDCD